MQNILIFVTNILVQSLMFVYLIIVTSKLIIQQKINKNSLILTCISSIIGITLLEILNEYITLINIIGGTLLVLFITTIIFKIKLSKSILITVITFLQVTVSELLTAFLSMLIFKVEIIDMISTNQRTLLLCMQCTIAIITISIIYLIINKKHILSDFIGKLTYKHIITYSFTLAIYFIPTIVLLIIGNYKYPPIFLFINAMQFAIICVFLFSYLKKTIENEKSQSDLFTSELHNKTLIGMVDGVRTLKHDYNNIMQSLNGYISTKQYDKLQEHINSVLKECNIVNNLSVIDPKVFNEPAIYGIVGSKFFLANEDDIAFDIDVTTDISDISFSKPELSRILGILLDNAIDATKKVKNQYIRLEFKYDNRKNADIIRVINTYDTNININLVDIYKKGFSTKEVKSGIGLWEVKKLINKSHNSQIFAEIRDDKFIQNIIIEK